MWLCNRGLKLLPVRGGRGRIDYIGATLLTAGVTALLLVLSWGGSEYPWGSPVILTMTVAALVLFTVLAWHEKHTSDAILPPRLFAEPIFMRGVCLAFMAAFGLLGTTFLLPLFFQLVRGADASESGLLVMPYMIANVIGAYAGGLIMRKLGRTRMIIVAGLAATALGFAIFTSIGHETPGVVLLLAMVVVGGGIGVCMPTILVTVQNASPRRDVGSATGALLFLRSMGGAFGATAVGAALSLEFAMKMQAAGFPGINFGALREGGALTALGAAAQASGQAALTSGFRLAFTVQLVLFVGAVVLALGLRDLPLRATAAGAAEEQPAALGH